MKAQAVCHYCGKVLPEPEHTHIVWVENAFKEVVPVCINCMATKKYKPLRLERAR